MDCLPNEIAMEIGGYCDIPSLICVRKVNRQWYHVSNAILKKVEELDLAKDIEPLFFSGEVYDSVVEWERTDALRGFLKTNMPAIKTLKINSSRIIITQSNFISIGLSLPWLNSLEIDDAQKRNLGRDIFYYLHNFANLKRLSIKRWNVFNYGLKGCATRSTLPCEKLKGLHHLSLKGNELIYHVLETLSKSERGDLQTLDLTFTESSPRSITAYLMFRERYEEVKITINHEIQPSEEVLRARRAMLEE